MTFALPTFWGAREDLMRLGMEMKLPRVMEILLVLRKLGQRDLGEHQKEQPPQGPMCSNTDIFLDFCFLCLRCPSNPLRPGLDPTSPGSLPGSELPYFGPHHTVRMSFCLVVQLIICMTLLCWTRND